VLAVAAALHILFGTGVAMAQTVMVRKAPPGGTVELVVNTAIVATAKTDPGGDATLIMNLAETTGKTEIDANVFVDVCPDNLRRVVIAEQGQPPGPQPAGCDRRDSGALFLIRRVSTLLVDVGGTLPTIVLRQGPIRLGPPRVRRPPRGLVAFGGAGLAQTRDLELAACGNVTECSADTSGAGYTGGATIWIMRYLGAEVSYVRPPEGEATGTLTDVSFDSAFDAHVTTITGKAGVPIGPVRLYGQGGMNYHRATFSTSQTSGDLTQTFELRTSGWGWTFGGGIEVWVSSLFGLYGEFGRAALKGTGRDDSEAVIDDRLTYFFGGVRFRVAGR
jgi:hypothetical protein